MFYPPRQVLGFNPQLKFNDSLLAYSYAEAYDISFPEASRRLAVDVEQLVACIRANGSYEIDGIGTISINGDGAYEFEPFEAGVLTPSLYGFSSFAAEPIADVKQENSQPSQSVIEKRFTAETQSDKDIPDEPSGSDDADYIRIPRKWLRYTAVACIALFLIMLIPLPTTTIMDTLRAGQMDSSLLYRMLPKANTEMPVAELGRNAVKPKLSAEVGSKAAAPKQAGGKAKPAPADSAATTAALAKAAGKAIEHKAEKETGKSCFAIVLASKVGKANAENFVATIAKKGYAEGRVAKMSQGYRVFYGRYASMSEANAAKSKLSSNDLFADCWIMETADAEAK